MSNPAPGVLHLSYTMRQLAQMIMNLPPTSKGWLLPAPEPCDMIKLSHPQDEGKGKLVIQAKAHYKIWWVDMVTFELHQHESSTALHITQHMTQEFVNTWLSEQLDKLTAIAPQPPTPAQQAPVPTERRERLGTQKKTKEYYDKRNEGIRQMWLAEPDKGKAKRNIKTKCGFNSDSSYYKLLKRIGIDISEQNDE